MDYGSRRPRNRGVAGGGQDITVHAELLARSLMRKQEGAAADEQLRATASSHRLFRVPVHLRDNNANNYTPGFVAIGPLHNREDRRLRPAERLKVAYLNGLISRGHPDPATHLAVIQEYVRIVAAREQEARAMYVAEEVTDIVADDFIQMMVLDGCFIIEQLVNVATGREEPGLHATPFGPAQVSVDLVLAENQIPFFVLIDLVAASRLPEFEATGYPPQVLLVKLVLFYLAGEKGRDMSDDALPATDGVSHILHLLYDMVTAARTRWEPPPRAIQDGPVMQTAQEVARLLRRLPLLLFVPLLYLILPDDKKRSASYGLEDVASASELKRMGVKFKKAHSGSGSKRVVGIASVLGPVPLAVKLRQHEDLLHLPQLRLEFRTAPLLLNLMAFEQLASTTTALAVSAYMCFMAKIVQSAEDAGVLTAAGVLLWHGGMGNEVKEEVARFFRAMGAASQAGGAGNDTKEGAARFSRGMGATSEAAAGGELRKESYLHELLKKLRERSRHPLFVMWADVQRNSFTLLAELLTLVTFVSTLIQTYAAFRYH